jgi:hypothetical protein
VGALECWGWAACVRACAQNISERIPSVSVLFLCIENLVHITRWGARLPHMRDLCSQPDEL